MVTNFALFSLLCVGAMSFPSPKNDTRSYLWDNYDNEYLVLCFPVVDRNNLTYIPAWRKSCCRYRTYEQQKHCDEMHQRDLARKWKIAGIVLGSIGLLVMLCCTGFIIATCLDI